ncbi:MAG: hypothetical protein V2A71_02480 [Candidatus Eisenbacteria bacterium]
MRHNYALVVLVCAIFACGLLAAGCWNPFNPSTKDGAGGTVEELKERTSPENVLHNFRVIYGSKDNAVLTPEDGHSVAEEYRELFSPDSFRFWFIPADLPEDLKLIGWWGTNDEVASLDSMLTGKALGAVTDIQLTWNVPPAVPDDRVGTSHWMHIEVRQILLDVVQGANTLRVASGTADFYFSRDPRNSNLWVIIEWIDRQPPSGSPRAMPAADENNSWGKIKGLFH